MSSSTTTHHLSVDGIGSVPLSVAQQGEGQPFLVLHGDAGPQSMDAFAGLLADTQQARVIVPTLPGVAGASRPSPFGTARGLAALYVALLEDLGLTDVTVVGHAIGGWIAAEIALLASARVARLVLVDAPGIGDAGPVGTDPTLLERLAKLDLATLVVSGAGDRIADPEVGRAFAAAIPGARFELVDGTGPLLAAVTAFVTSHPAWCHETTAETSVAPEQIWATLRDLYTGTRLSDRGDTIEIHGPFAVGTTLSATPPDSDLVIGCTIVDLVDGEVFAFRSEFNGLMITSRFTLTAPAGTGARVTHRSTIEGPRAEKLGPRIGPRITADHPEAMNDVIVAATARGTRD